MNSDHHLTLNSNFLGELHLEFVCTAAPDAPCRMRPSVMRDSWQYGDPDLTPCHECWAVEFIQDCGWEDAVRSAPDISWPKIPITIGFDDGVVIGPWKADS